MNETEEKTEMNKGKKPEVKVEDTAKPSQDIEKKDSSKDSSNKIAIIRIRSAINAKNTVKDTLKLLNLNKKNQCVVYEKNPAMIGMIKKIKDYVTYGEIDDNTFKELINKKGELYKGRIQDSKGKIQYKKFIDFEGKKYKKYFRLNPPKGGFEKGGIKRVFNNGGALGYRKDKINGLIQKMI